MIRHFPWFAIGVLVVLGLLFWPFLLLFAAFMIVVVVAGALTKGRRR